MPLLTPSKGEAPRTLEPLDPASCHGRPPSAGSLPNSDNRHVEPLPPPANDVVPASLGVATRCVAAHAEGCGWGGASACASGALVAASPGAVARTAPTLSIQQRCRAITAGFAGPGRASAGLCLRCDEEGTGDGYRSCRRYGPSGACRSRCVPWRSKSPLPDLPGSIVSLSIPDHPELAPGTLRQLIRLAGIDVETFRAALG